MQNQHSDLVERLSQLAQAMAEGQSKGMFRCEDMISATAAFVGECAMCNADELDVDNHPYAPGRAIFSQRINMVLSGDRTDWREVPITSTFGALYGILTHAGAPGGAWDPRIFPDIAGIYQSYAAARGPNAPAGQWGFVPLGVAPGHAPKMPPLRAAFELRRLAFANRTAAFPSRTDLSTVSQLALVKVLTKTRRAIAEAVAIKLAFETINGMAKTAPVLLKHMQPGGQRAAS